MESDTHLPRTHAVAVVTRTGIAIVIAVAAAAAVVDSATTTPETTTVVVGIIIRVADNMVCRYHHTTTVMAAVADRISLAHHCPNAAETRRVVSHVIDDRHQYSAVAGPLRVGGVIAVVTI